MTEREAIHKLRLDLMACSVLLHQLWDEDATNWPRAGIYARDADKTLLETDHFKPTIEELKAWESRPKPWLKNT